MNINPLLDFIARYESGGDYNIVWGGIAAKDRPPKPLVKMTVQEVLNWQDSIDPHYMSEAAGRYQVMEDTLRGLVDNGLVDASAFFNHGTQDSIAIALLRRRGLEDYLRGKMSMQRFGNSVAREWAALPVLTDIVKKNGQKVRRGSSYYSGDGLNAAHAPLNEYVRVLKLVTAPPVEKPPVRQQERDSKSPFAQLWSFIVNLLRSLK